MTLQAFNTVGLNGIDRDGSYSGGSGIFSVSFFREVFPASCLVVLNSPVFLSLCLVM